MCARQVIFMKRNPKCTFDEINYILFVYLNGFRFLSVLM